MPVCPNCSTRLEPGRTSYGLHYACRGCGGRAVTVPVMHRALSNEFMRGFWGHVLRSCETSPKPCPFCTRWMKVIHAGDPSLELDACLTCQVVWFDEREFEC